jgi:hypothetical protein
MMWSYKRRSYKIAAAAASNLLIAVFVLVLEFMPRTTVIVVIIVSSEEKEACRNPQISEVSLCCWLAAPNNHPYTSVSGRVFSAIVEKRLCVTMHRFAGLKSVLVVPPPSSSSQFCF